jgi:hypothetical protein
MLAFKDDFTCATSSIAGVELLGRIRKDRYKERCSSLDGDAHASSENADLDADSVSVEVRGRDFRVAWDAGVTDPVAVLSPCPRA